MLKVFSRYIPLKTIVLMVTENLWITATMTLVSWVRSRYILQEADSDIQTLLWKVALITIIFQISLFYYDLYDLSVVDSRLGLTLRAVQSFGSASVALGLLFFVLPDLMIGAGNYVVVASVILGVIVLLAWRTLVGFASSLYEVPRRLLVVGTGEMAVDLVQALHERPDLNLKVIGFLGESPEEVGTSLVNPKVLGITDQLEEMVDQYQITRVVVALSDRRKKLPVKALLKLKLHGATIDDAHSLYERVTGKIRTTALPPSWLVFSDGFHEIARKVRHKRFLDFPLALFGAIVSLPVSILVAIAIKLDSAGPVLFRQERVGYRGDLFNVIKFRTMRQDAEALSGPKWATEDDPRITRVGRFLRKSRLDEIPQIWNVLRGDMSFVGPRPERPHFVDMLTEQLNYYAERQSVPPGLTGWAQIRYHYGSSVKDALEKLQYDLFYIKNLSIFLDIYILFETGKIVLFGRGR